jgi:hypothetical protein
MFNEFFKNSAGCNTACINLSTKQGEIDLYYHLHDNPVQHMWQELFLEDSKIVQGNSFGQSYESLYVELSKTCASEGIVIPKTFTQDYLNDLHSLYVKSNKNSNWLKINDLIHLIENKLSNIAAYDYSFNFYSENSSKLKLKEEHKLFLASDSVWGRLNLGYATLGKDWVTISANNDDDRDLKLQEYVTTETYASFSPEEPYDKHREQQFYKWSKSTNLDVPTNLNDLSFGRYILGSIIITDVFLDYNKNSSDWYVPNHSCKWKWNKDVLGADIKVNNVNFLDTDLYYSTLIKHTGIRECIK